MNNNPAPHRKIKLKRQLNQNKVLPKIVIETLFPPKSKLFFIFFSVLSNLNSKIELTLLNLVWDFCLLHSTFLKVLLLMAVNLSRYSLTDIDAR